MDNFDQESTPRSKSHESEPLRYKSLTQLYTETNPMQVEGEECIILFEEPSTYAKAAH